MLGSAQVERGLQLGQVQLQLVGWRTVPKGVGWGRVQRPVWLYHEAFVLFQGQGLQGRRKDRRLLSPNPARLLLTPHLRSLQLWGGILSPFHKGVKKSTQHDTVSQGALPPWRQSNPKPE